MNALQESAVQGFASLQTIGSWRQNPVVVSHESIVQTLWSSHEGQATSGWGPVAAAGAMVEASRSTEKNMKPRGRWGLRRTLMGKTSGGVG
jgi:hypothetical protein